MECSIFETPFLSIILLSVKSSTDTIEELQHRNWFQGNYFLAINDILIEDKIIFETPFLSIILLFVK